MCLIAFAYDQHPDYALVFAANRDEFYNRPTAPADFWDEAPAVLAGRDLQAGGTWMGVTHSGRFAAVTNVREPGEHRRKDAPSRGALVSEYLRSGDGAVEYTERTAERAERFNGFNLLVGAPGVLRYLSNRDGVQRAVAPGLHAISNDRLDTPWPKVERAKAQLAAVLETDDPTPESLLELLADRTRPPKDALPDTGVPEAWEHVLAPIFITSPSYGTRSSTVLLIRRDGQVTFVERTFGAEGRPTGTQRFSFDIDSVTAS